LTCLLCAARPKAPAEQFSQALVPNPFRAEYDDLAAFLKEVHPETLTIFGGSAPCSPDARITRGTVSAGEAVPALERPQERIPEGKQ